MGQIATSKGLTTEQFSALMVDARNQAIDQAVKAGTLTQAQADWMKQRGAGQMGGIMNGQGQAQGQAQGQMMGAAAAVVCAVGLLAAPDRVRTPTPPARCTRPIPNSALSTPKNGTGF